MLPDKQDTFSSQKSNYEIIASNLGQCWQEIELYPCYTWSSLGWWGPSSQGLRCLHRSTMSPSYPALSRATPSVQVLLFQSFPLSTWRWFANSCFQVPHNHNMSPFNNIKCYWEYLQTPISSDSRVLSQPHKINNPGQSAWCSAMMSCYSYSLAASPCNYCPLPSLLHPLGSPVGGQRWAVGTPAANLTFITVIKINVMSKYEFCLIGCITNWNISFFHAVPKSCIVGSVLWGWCGWRRMPNILWCCLAQPSPAQCWSCHQTLGKHWSGCNHTSHHNR